jgi:hypothetical protein
MNMINYIINRQMQIGHLRMSLSWRKKSNLTGRFGGGWNWKVGVQIGRACIIISLLVLMVRFEWVRSFQPFSLMERILAGPLP